MRKLITTAVALSIFTLVPIGSARTAEQEAIVLSATTRQSAGPSDLIFNGSFELALPGARPKVPTNWLAQGWSPADRVELISDATAAHRGQRFLRLRAPGEHGIRMHSIVDEGKVEPKQLDPGVTYMIRLWARRAAEVPATLRIQPGDFEARLGSTWQQYAVVYSHPKDAAPPLGMFFEILGGPVDVDDVSMVPTNQEEPVPPELRSDWVNLRIVPGEEHWRVKDDELYRERVPVVIRETAGEPVRRHLVSILLKDIFRSYKYDFVSPKTIQVVDSAAEGAPAVPWALVAPRPERRLDADRPTGEDLLVFLVDCPPLSQKTYYVYLVDRNRRADPFDISDAVPETLSVKDSYAHELNVDVGDTQPILSASARMSEQKLDVQVDAWIAESIRAEIVDPEGRRRFELPLNSSRPGQWSGAENWRFPAGAPQGVWQVRVTAENAKGDIETTMAPFVYGHALWWEGNSRRVYRTDRPRYGRNTARLAAAANEWEAFQVAISSAEGLSGVRLAATDLVQEGGEAKIGSDKITIEQVLHTLVFSSAELRSGLSPDALLPWSPANVSPHTQAVAWVTVRVPTDAPAGIYRGAVLAEADHGWRSELPVELEVFDFSLPDSFGFTTLIGAGISRSTVRANKPPDSPSPRSKDLRLVYRSRNNYNVISDQRQTLLDLYRYLGQRHITPTGVGLFSIYGEQSGAPIYDPDTHKFDIDLTILDKIIEMIEKERLDVKLLVHMGGERVRGGLHRAHTGGVRVENAQQPGEILSDMIGTKQGDLLLRLWLEAIREKLRPKGWSNRVLFYVCDEDLNKRTKLGLANDLVVAFNDLIHSVAPEFRTYVAGTVFRRHSWLSALENTDVFTGFLDPSFLERFLNGGGTWWGVYNRWLYVSRPLGSARMVALDCWRRGWKHYWHYHATHWEQGYWVDPNLLVYCPANGGYPSHFFVQSGYMPGFYMIYPWPSHKEAEWRRGMPAFAGSIQIEAIRESMEDYEYLSIVEKFASDVASDSEQASASRLLLDQVRSFMEQCDQRDESDTRYYGARSAFVVDGDQWQKLRRQMARINEAILRDAPDGPKGTKATAEK